MATRWTLPITVGALVLAACGSPGGEEPRGAAEEAAAAQAPTSLETVTLVVPSMSCPLCSRSIEERLKQAGLRDIRIDLDAKLVRARFESGRISVGEIRSIVEAQGFPVTEARVGE